ncbi:MAG: hypothetical protein ACFFBD_20755 [Candidatus Hodarchaeota archaeon]
MSKKKRLERIGSKFKKPESANQIELMQEFLFNLETITDSVEEVLDDIDEEYEEQVIQKRGISEKISASVLPSSLQPSQVRLQEAQKEKFSNTREKLRQISNALGKMKVSLTVLPSSEEMGKRIYTLAYPGSQEVSTEKLIELEARLENLEYSFYEAFETLNTRMKTMVDAMQTMGHELQKQGLRLEQIDQKVDEVNTRLERATEQLVEISKKLMSNKTILAFIIGAVASAIAVLVLVP